ncbi:uncharacterized protein PRCAT00004051001 [Priceomyces carsonii]|uniref:uncharacterized protein n=1 Tax=Priceomyces carsonii TaxID=28549 RepID=UPI002ED9E4F9|nr:unnamed protein product [Priceomyces carsonii]
MTCTQRDLLLKDILNSILKFHYFDEIVEISEKDLISHHDALKLNKIVDYLVEYVRGLLEVFDDIKTRDKEEDLEWYYQGRIEVYEIGQNLDSIDSILSQIVGVIDKNINQSHVDQILSKCEDISDLLLNAKACAIMCKKKANASVNFKELKENTIQSLDKELDDCLKELESLYERKLSSPRKYLTKFNLQEIMTKMRINDLSLGNQLLLETIRLPTFNEFDESLYNDYMTLKMRIGPLEMSLVYLQMRIDEFKAAFGLQFLGATENILIGYNEVLKKWDFFLLELSKVKKVTLDCKWVEIFSYLIDEITSNCDSLLKQLKTDLNVTDDIGRAYKLCSNSITLITKAFNEKIVYDNDLFVRFNESLLQIWNELNDILTNSTQAPASIGGAATSVSVGLKSFQIVKKVSDLAIKDSMSNGCGFDLRLGVETTKVPFSIEKRNRIRDVFDEDPTLKGKSLKNAFANFTLGNEREDDELTLVNKTPNLQHESTIDTRLKDKIFDSNEFLNSLTENKLGIPSEIPIIAADYFDRRLPSIKKMDSSNLCKIPTICPSHRIFQSPVRMSREPLAVTKQSTQRASIGLTYSETDIFRRPLSRNTSPNRYPSRDSSRSGSSLGGTFTPDLSYKPIQTKLRTPSFNSTSPERPPSSIGSRFDEEHLVQPLKPIKPTWK